MERKKDEEEGVIFYNQVASYKEYRITRRHARVSSGIGAPVNEQADQRIHNAGFNDIEMFIRYRHCGTMRKN